MIDYKCTARAVDYGSILKILVFVFHLIMRVILKFGLGIFLNLILVYLFLT